MYTHTLNSLTVVIKVNRDFHQYQAGAGNKTVVGYMLWVRVRIWRMSFLTFSEKV